MSPEQLAARHVAAIQRHWRTLADSGGKAAAGLLGELAGIADEHAREVGETREHPGRITITCTQHGVTNCPCLSVTVPAGGPAAPRRRAPARGRAK